MKFSTHLMQHQFEMVWQWKYFEDTQMKTRKGRFKNSFNKNILDVLICFITIISRNFDEIVQVSVSCTKAKIELSIG